jgi:hypothetical protein
MTIGAANFALRNFDNECFDRDRVSHERANCRTLDPNNVIELEEQRIRYATINAGMIV